MTSVNREITIEGDDNAAWLKFRHAHKTRVSEGHGNGLVLVHERPQRGNLGTRLKVDAQQMPELGRILEVLASHEVDDDVVGGLAAVLRKRPTDQLMSLQSDERGKS